MVLPQRAHGRETVALAHRFPLRYSSSKGSVITSHVAAALNLPGDYFLEARLAFIAEHLGDHPQLLDSVYDQLRRRRPS